MHNLFGMIKWVLIVVVILLWFAVCLQNLSVSAPFVLISGHVEYTKMSVSMMLILPFVIAFLCFWIVGMLDQVDQFLVIRQLKKQIRDLEREVNQLRKLPIREGMEAQEAVEKENEG